MHVAEDVFIGFDAVLLTAFWKAWGGSYIRQDLSREFKRQTLPKLVIPPRRGTINVETGRRSHCCGGGP
jgi:hypothetical protein